MLFGTLSPPQAGLAACLPRWRKELAARIKGDVFQRLDEALFSLKFLVNFYVTFPCKTTYIALRTERSRDLSG